MRPKHPADWPIAVTSYESEAVAVAHMIQDELTQNALYLRARETMVAHDEIDAYLMREQAKDWRRPAEFCAQLDAEIGFLCDICILRMARANLKQKEN